MKNIKMKLIMISFCVSVIFITNVKALSIEDFNNSETVKTTASSTITREEYLKLKENYSDLMIDTFTQDSIDVILKDNSNYVEEYIVTTTYADYFGNIIITAILIFCSRRINYIGFYGNRTRCNFLVSKTFPFYTIILNWHILITIYLFKSCILITVIFIKHYSQFDAKGVLFFRITRSFKVCIYLV